MGDLLLHSTVSWINAPAILVKSKKDPDLAAFGKVLLYNCVFEINGTCICEGIAFIVSLLYHLFSLKRHISQSRN